jgi:hypothetical protein
MGEKDYHENFSDKNYLTWTELRECYIVVEVFKEMFKEMIKKK